MEERGLSGMSILGFKSGEREAGCGLERSARSVSENLWGVNGVYDGVGKEGEEGRNGVEWGRTVRVQRGIRRSA